MRPKLLLTGALCLSVISCDRADPTAAGAAKALPEVQAQLKQTEDALAEAKHQVEESGKTIAELKKARDAAEEKARAAQEKSAAATKLISEFPAGMPKGTSEEVLAKMESLRVDRDRLKQQLEDVRQMSELLAGRLSAGSAAANGGADTPAQFPWPAPRPTSSQVLPSQVLANLIDFASADQKLAGALNFAGYRQRTYFPVPGGFAIATKVEGFDPDGASKLDPDRWFNEVAPTRTFSVPSYQSALYVAPAGRYRVIVFAVTDVGLTQGGSPLSKADAKAWTTSGLNALPATIGAQRLTNKVKCTALIYEFQQDAPMQQAKITSNGLSAETHLQKSRIGLGLQ